MWCYQRPGFEALLLAELQRQQQCNQFCDTLLKAEGVSVPAHSCIVSAISPHISAALSSTPPPPAGQSRLLDFQALGACTLLHVVRLLYSGEMAGEGEKEKQEAISAAANLGIHGLVEVRRGCGKNSQGGGEDQIAEVGVQTETFEESVRAQGGWRRAVKDGNTFLWKETLSVSGTDTWTQTEELQLNTAPPSYPAASFETIDLGSFQSLTQASPSPFPPHVPYIPISVVYPLDENQTHQLSSALVDPLSHTSFPPSIPSISSKATPCDADLQSWWIGPLATAEGAEGSDDAKLEQFQGNITGYINYFLNPEKEKDSCTGRGRGRRRGAGVGGARRARAGETRARRPRARTGGRGRGGLMQTVDVQDVEASKLHKLFLHRWGVRAFRTGQGGGAAGRKLSLKTREFLKSVKSCPRRRARYKKNEFEPIRDPLPASKRGAHTTPGILTQVSNQLQEEQRESAKSTPPLSFSSPPVRAYNAHALSASSSSLQHSSSPGLFSPAASYASPAPSLLYNTAVPPPPALPHEERPEQIDQLLEEVMMGLNIIPTSSASCSQPSLPASSSSCTNLAFGNALAPNKQQNQVVAVARGVSSFSAANGEVLVLQQQGELNEMLEHFLLSFEQHVANSTAREKEKEKEEEEAVSGRSCTETPARSSEKREQRHNDAEKPARLSQPLRASARQAACPKRTKEAWGNATPPEKKRKKRRRKNDYAMSLEKKRLKNPAPLTGTKINLVHDRGDKQLQQRAVVKLERSHLLPNRGGSQGHSLDIQSLSKTNASSSSAKCGDGSSSDKHNTAWWHTKTYPIRSRIRNADMDSMHFLERPLGQHKQPPSAKQPGGRHRRPRNVRLLSLSDRVSSPPTQPQPVEPCGTEEQPGNNQDTPKELAVQSHEEADGAEAGDETSDDVTVEKEMPQLTSEAQSRTAEDVIDVETVSQAGVGHDLRSEEQAGKPLYDGVTLGEETNGETESSDETIDVEDCCQKDNENDRFHGRAAPVTLVRLGSTGSCNCDQDEDVDVIGTSSPAPDPVVISWSELSEGEKEDEDEDVDIV